MVAGAGGAGVVHRVADGESLQDIALAYGVDIDRLLEERPG